MFRSPLGNSRLVVFTELFWPCRPTPGILALSVEISLQGIIDGLLHQAVTTFGDEIGKGLATIGILGQLGAIKHLAQHFELGHGDAGVIHPLLGPQRLQTLLESRSFHFSLHCRILLIFRNGGDINVNHVQPATR